jgi:ABC-type branched-subunit amino acid transport system ATPase component/ABC-type branched-subunit amino acid transport system permease subunit
MYATFVYVELRSSGDLVQPVLGLPARIHLADSLNLAAALPLALGVAAITGLLVYVLIFRPLRHAPPVTRLVASVGLMLTLQAIAVLRFGTANRPLTTVLPAEPITLLGVVVPRDRLYLAAIVVVLSAVFAGALRWTRLGLAVRAVGDDERSASVVGWSPSLVGAASWAAASMVAALAGILAAPVTGLNPSTTTLLVVPALAAAAVGRMTSFGVTVAAGLALGMLQSEITKFQATFDWVPQVGLKDGLPLLVIVVAVAAGGTRLSGRGEDRDRWLPHARRPRHALAFAASCAVVGAIGAGVLPGPYRGGLVVSMIGAFVCLSLVVLVGFVGQLSLVQLGVAGVAGFTLTELTNKVGVPFPIAPVLAAATAGAVGVLLGLPSLRVRGLQLAIVSLAAAVALDELVFANASLTGGLAGRHVPRPRLFGLDLGAGASPSEPRVAFAVVVACVLGISVLLVANLRRSATGRHLLAVRADENAAAAAGIDVASAKLRACAVASVIAGIGGALAAYQHERVSFESFGVFVSLAYLAAASIGGIASVGGALIGALLIPGGLAFVTLGETIDIGRYELATTGVLLLLMIVVNPGGLAGLITSCPRRANRVPSSNRPVVVQEPIAGEGEDRAREVVDRGGSVAAEGEHPLLQVREIDVRFGGVHAVRGVSLDVHAGQLLGLIGPNGAGKTALLDAITGLAPATGSVVLDGWRIDALAPHARAWSGVRRTFQEVDMLVDLTVGEQLRAAAERTGWRTLVGDLVRPGAIERAALPALCGLELDSDADVTALLPDDRRLVAIARALAGRPRCLLLDEPAAGMDAAQVAALGRLLQRIADDGTAIVLIEHDVELVFAVCDEVIVLVDGRVLVRGSPDELRADPRVARAFLGDGTPLAAPARSPAAGTIDAAESASRAPEGSPP